MSKKFIIISVVAIVVIAAAGFAIYKQNSPAPKQAPIQQSQDPQNSDVQANIGQDGIKTQNPNGTGNLIVCQDKCGDGVCQPVGTVCLDNLNCPCSETMEDCPKDCK